MVLDIKQHGVGIKSCRFNTTFQASQCFSNIDAIGCFADAVGIELAIRIDGIGTDARCLLHDAVLAGAGPCPSCRTPHSAAGSGGTHRIGPRTPELACSIDAGVKRYLM